MDRPPPTSALARLLLASTLPTKGNSRRATAYPPSTKKCPYRKDSTKAAAFAIFAKGGARADMLAAITKLGAPRNSASTWIQQFKSFAVRGEK